MPSVQFQLLRIIFRLRRLMDPPTGELDVEKSRLETEALAARFKTKIEFSRNPISLNNVPGEWVVPSGKLNNCVILYLHGGSYNAGSIRSHRSLAANIANTAKARALLIDYRLAPEHQFPAAVEDSVIAYQWLLENGHEPNHIVIAGDSAGGGLVLSLLVSLRESKIQLPSAAVCLSPWVDLTCTGESWRTNSPNDLMLDPGEILKSAELYLGGSDPRTPLASPLFADLRGLPPILIQVGSDEFLLSDATSLAENARAAEVEVTLEVWDRMQHEWHFADNFIPEARRALEQIGEFIKKHA